jgi:hypothetical protein
MEQMLYTASIECDDFYIYGLDGIKDFRAEIAKTHWSKQLNGSRLAFGLMKDVTY